MSGASCRNGKTKRRRANHLRCRWRQRNPRAPAQSGRRCGRERPEQSAYAEAAAYAFAPRERAGAPRVALIEAGTGIGKTLGYLAPASLWAEKNGAGALDFYLYPQPAAPDRAGDRRLYPDPAELDEKAVVRKGRENYLCLLNFEEAVRRTALAPGPRMIALALIARWIAASADGDISGAGFPAFSPRECLWARSPTGAANASMRRVRITALFHRARDSPLAQGADRRRQSRPRHRAGGAGLALGR